LSQQRLFIQISIFRGHASSDPEKDYARILTIEPRLNLLLAQC
jgi:hypothetical protein